MKVVVPQVCSNFVTLTQIQIVPELVQNPGQREVNQSTHPWCLKNPKSGIPDFWLTLAGNIFESFHNLNQHLK